MGRTACTEPQCLYKGTPYPHTLQTHNKGNKFNYVIAIPHQVLSDLPLTIHYPIDAAI